MKIEIDTAASTSVPGRIAGLLMIALLAALTMSCAPQATSQNPVIIEMSPAGDIIQVTRAEGTPIPPVANPYPTPKIAKPGKQLMLYPCIICVPGNGCWQIC